MAANVPKRVLTKMVKARSYSSEAFSHGGHGGENADKLRVMWRRLSFAGFGVVGICTVYNYLIHKEHEKHFKQPEFVPYSYLTIRKKKFPWGDGNHSLLHNPRHNALQNGYEVTD